MRITRITGIVLIGILLVLGACGSPARITQPATSPGTGPAAFATSELTITPKTVKPGEPVAVGVMVTNTGGEQGTYTVVMKLHDGTIVKTLDVTLAGGARQKVTLSMSMNSVGTHMIMIDELAGNLVVQDAAAPTPTQPAPTQPAPGVTPTTFTDGAFVISNLTITPKGTAPSKEVTVGVTVRNNGGRPDTYKVVMKIQDNKTKMEDVKTQDVTLAGGASQQVEFTIAAGGDGVYTIMIGNLFDTLTVDEHAYHD